MKKHPNILIAACTLARPQGLEEMIGGLERLTFERVEPRIELLIVDNDAQPSAKAWLSQKKEILPWPLHYHHQPQRGLVHARNTVLDHIPEHIDWLAMLDDDEVPVSHWLEALLITAFEHQAHMVAGPVCPVFSEPAPPWATEGRFFEVGPFEEGVAVKSVPSGNALVSVAMINKHHLRFDTRFNLTGGEDEMFFKSAIRLGYKAVGSANATIFETIAPSRVSPGWLRRRYLRMGTTLSLIDFETMPYLQVLINRTIKGFGRMALGLFLLLTGLWHRQTRFMRGYCEFFYGLGHIVGLWGTKINEYGRKRPYR